jgi:magnesium transporter
MDAHQGKKEQTDQVLLGRFSFFSSKTQQTTASSTWDGLFPNRSFDQVFQEQLKSRSNPKEPIWWIDIRDATKKDVNTVSQALSIHRLTAENIAIREPCEKVDVYKKYYLLSFQTLVTNTGTEERLGIPTSAALYILVFQYGVVTFSPSGCGHVSRTTERIRKMHDPTVLTSHWVCYALMYVRSFLLMNRIKTKSIKTNNYR